MAAPSVDPDIEQEIRCMINMYIMIRRAVMSSWLDSIMYLYNIVTQLKIKHCHAQGDPPSKVSLHSGLPKSNQRRSKILTNAVISRVTPKSSYAST